MIYNDDQCERCGGNRVAKSTLCAECLVEKGAFLEREIIIKGMLIERLRKKLGLQTGRLEDALRYGFKQNQENILLLKYTKELERKIWEAMQDEKDG